MSNTVHLFIFWIFKIIFIQKWEDFSDGDKSIDPPKSQRIALDVLMRQLESVDKEIEHMQKQIAEVAREDEDIIILITIPGIDYYSAMIISRAGITKETVVE